MANKSGVRFRTTVNPSTQGNKGEKLYLITGSNKVVDSAMVIDGKFNFALKNVTPDEYVLVRTGLEVKNAVVLIYLDNSDTFLKLEKGTYSLFHTEFINYTTNGSTTQKLVSEINSMFMNDVEWLKNKDNISKQEAVITRGDMASAFVLWKYNESCCEYINTEKLRSDVNGLKTSVKESAC